MASRRRQCVILAGGLGTRLGSLVEEIPKPMLPVSGRPFLEHLVRTISRFGFDSFVFLAGYHGERVSTHFSSGGALANELGAQFQTIIEPEPCGTGGALKLAREELEEEFLMCNGDSFFDFNFLDLSARALPGETLARLALRRVSDASRYGTVSIDGEYITEFSSGSSDFKSSLMNAGVYWMKAKLLDFLDSHSSLEREVFPRLAAGGQLLGSLYNGFFIDIGVPEKYQLASRLISAALRRPAVFFDRDGVLNADSGYTHDPENFKWMPGAKSAIKYCNDNGYFVFVVTNQSGVARGYYDENAVRRLHSWMQDELRSVGAHIDAFRYCPHHIEGVLPAYAIECGCRKPKPGMMVDLLNRWPVRSESSILIGNMPSDIAAGVAAGISSFRFSDGNLETFLREILLPEEV